MQRKELCETSIAKGSALAERTKSAESSYKYHPCASHEKCGSLKTQERVMRLSTNDRYGGEIWDMDVRLFWRKLAKHNRGVGRTRAHEIY